MRFSYTPRCFSEQKEPVRPDSRLTRRACTGFQSARLRENEQRSRRNPEIGRTQNDSAEPSHCDPFNTLREDEVEFVGSAFINFLTMLNKDNCHDAGFNIDAINDSIISNTNSAMPDKTVSKRLS